MSLQLWIPLNGKIENQGLYFSNDGFTTSTTPPTVNENGKIGQCYAFNGNFLRCSYPARTNEISFCVWLKFNTISNCHIIDARTSGSTGYQPLYYGHGSGIQVGCNKSSFPYIPYTFTAGKWYHVAITYNSQKTSLYVNGQLINSAASSKAFNYEQDLLLTLGGRGSSSGSSIVNPFNGYLNDFRLYDHCLSKKEVEEIAKGLVLHYKLDDTYINTSSIIDDVSGYKNIGTKIGTLSTNIDAPKYSYSTIFDGNSSGIYTEAKLSNIFNSNFTMSFWIKSDGENSNRSVYFGNYQTDYNFNIEKDVNNLIRFYWHGSPDLHLSGTAVLDGVWNLITIVKTNTAILTYINGVLKNTDTSSLAARTFPNLWRIGRDSRTGTTCYKGKMSDFRIYATALSDKQILELYNTGGSIDSIGKIYAREYVELEEDPYCNINLNKRGQLIGEQAVEGYSIAGFQKYGDIFLNELIEY